MKTFLVDYVFPQVDEDIKSLLTSQPNRRGAEDLCRRISGPFAVNIKKIIPLDEIFDDYIEPVHHTQPDPNFYVFDDEEDIEEDIE
jgi:hypothetical protein